MNERVPTWSHNTSESGPFWLCHKQFIHQGWVWPPAGLPIVMKGSTGEFWVRLIASSMTQDMVQQGKEHNCFADPIQTQTYSHLDSVTCGYVHSIATWKNGAETLAVKGGLVNFYALRGVIALKVSEWIRGEVHWGRWCAFPDSLQF